MSRKHIGQTFSIYVEEEQDKADVVKVASAFHPSLAPVGVLLAVLGYALGTYGAWICGVLLQITAL